MAFAGEPPETDPASARSALEKACDEYVDAALEGAPPDLATFCDRHGDASGELRRRIEALGAVLARPGARETSGARADDELPFERIGEFRLVRLLGRGGASDVYLAQQESLGREVALKVVRPDRKGLPWAQARLHREAQSIAKLRHPHIVRVHAAGEEGGVRYVALELVPGAGLDERLREAEARRERIDVPRAVRWAAGLARALDCAHAAGIVHRDVKPSNVRIGGDDRAMLLDFGLARDESLAALTLTGEFHGTPHFASPEQIEARSGGVDARTDVYSLGATLYRCLAGRLPFEGETTEQVFHRVLSAEPPPLRQVRPDVSRDLETVVRKAMEKDRGLRYPTARALADDLDALLELRPIAARPPGRAERMLRWAQVHRATAAAAAAALAGALALVGVLVAQDLGERRRFANAVAASEAAFSRGAFDDALAGIERALAIRPDDADSLRRRIEWEHARDRALANAALDEARGRLREFLAAGEAQRAIREKLRPLEIRYASAYMAPERVRELSETSSALERERRRRDESEVALVQAVERARRLGAEEADASAVLVELDLDRWRESLESGDAVAEELLRRRVVAHDRAGTHREELEGIGVLAIEGTAGAEVFLFRFEELSRLAPGGEPRLVPVPFQPVRGAVPIEGFTPGEVVLEVDAVEPDGSGAAAGIRPGDLVLRFDGAPVRACVLVQELVAGGALEDAGAGVLDRVARFAGADVHDLHDTLHKGRDSDASGIEVELERGGDRRISLRVPRSGWSWAQSLATLALPETILGELRVPTAIRLAVLASGALRDVELPAGAQAGIESRRTAVPTPLVPECLLGRLPLGPTRAPRGSYLLVARKDGFETLRVPVRIQGKDTLRVPATLLPAGSTPEGFVWIPSGSIECGGDPIAARPRFARTVELPGFWIARHEVTQGEYLDFLNDPETLATIDAQLAAGRAVLVPRDTSSPHGFWERRDGRYHIRKGDQLTWPVHSIAWEDARAHAAWRTRRGLAAGASWAFDLPTEAEWEKAARGADGRGHPWGNVFRWSFCKGRLSSDCTLHPEPAGSSVRDASPWDVRDLAGNVREWCAEETSPTLRAVKGACYFESDVAPFRSASSGEATATGCAWNRGFRLVARPEP